MTEIHRRLAYDLHRCWESNDRNIKKLIRACQAAAVALVLELVLLAAVIGGNIT